MINQRSYRSSRIEPGYTVNDVLLQHPQTARVFIRFGIDNCAGGEETLAETAEHKAISADVLIGALREAAEPRH